MDAATIPTDRPITGDELLALGDIGPCELIDGRIVFVSPTGAEHGAIESGLGAELTVFVKRRKLGWVMTGVEILSPDDRWEDVRQRIEEYFGIGVERVWLVEPENKAVLVYRSVTEFERLDEAGTLAGEGVLDGFTVAAGSLFSE
jgi:Uma2 family endonuclease